MSLEFSADDRALQDVLRRFLNKACPTSRVHAVLDGSAGEARALTSALSEGGWMAAALPEEYGGQGLGYSALCTIAEELGRTLAPTSFGSTVFLAAEAILHGGSDAQKQRLLPGLGAGTLGGALALCERDGPIVERATQCTVRDGKLSGTKTPVVDGGEADVAVVSARSEAGVRLYVVDLAQTGVTRTALTSMDPTRPLAAIRFEDAEAELLGDGCDWDFVERLLDRAAVLFAFEQVGGADAALAMARDYALSRYAFGRPIGSFQAIKHKLADVYIANSLARANAEEAAWALTIGSPDLPLAAATARVAASEAYERAARENMQTHGGVSATWIHDCHLHYRRARHLNTCIGALPQWRNRVAERLITQSAA
ncbi:MAG: acyl-CoA dehydrogenase family protein [Aromatoleum sp.]|jgi:alkylation response protein AidB-like acyl-CoA dehydrogenase|uniref:acyl-CoA dehydrogenase family protein n=1 Tax=Aromatoleum sp. TaxID=2307007 RepID=UPI002895A500|nr:acyl-CoA dehydrogenase family protein [Aromatoleum sp.]MDT3670178.1 acyl-CoA dehydrogenase family protein [Aromatoleum sp.]